MLRPVEWKGPDSERRQGEIIGKGAVNKAYRQKLATAQKDPSLIATQDWDGIRAILDMLIHACD